MSGIISYINLAVTSAGLAVCVTGLILAADSVYIKPRSRRYFTVIFGILAAYIACDLAGQFTTPPGPGWALASQILLFIESLLSSAAMPMLTVFLLEASGIENIRSSVAFYAVTTVWLTYFALLVYTQFSDSIYYFDAGNVYHRGPYYPVLLVPPVVIMAINLVLLFIRRGGLTARERLAFGVYILAPSASMLIQMFSYGIYTIVIGTSVSAFFMFIQIQRTEQEEYARSFAENARVKLDIALAQIQPHFLYNSLTTIKHIIRKDPETAESAIDGFTGFLRHNMDSLTQEGPVPFETELEHVRQYLDLQKLRFGDDLNVEYDLECTDFRMPVLTLQPLVENAVSYGIRKSETGAGTVKVSTRRFPDRVEVRVADTGPGFDTEAPPEDRGRSHIGIRNVRERLEHISGGSLSVDSAPGEGTTVTILLPKEETEC